MLPDTKLPDARIDVSDPKAATGSKESFLDLETPAIVVDRARLLRNVERVQEIGRRHGVAVRPHIKTHKCVPVAELQLNAGACGITASKVSEAEVFVEAGVRSITLAYPLVDRRKARRALAAAQRAGCNLNVLADSRAGVECLETAAEEAGIRVGTYLKIDVGLHRAGLKPDDASLVPVARQICQSAHLTLRGLLSHAGHAYGAKDRAGARAVAESERQQMIAVKERLAAADIAVEEISVGSTPTVLAAENFDGVTEIRPGNYVYFDLTAVRLGVARLREVSLSALASVVSVNDQFAIVDAGSKVLSSDTGPHGATGGSGFGLAFPANLEIAEDTADDAFVVEKLSEEHGFVRLDGRRLRIGDLLRIVPNHSCPVANLSREVAVFGETGEFERWPVAAAGKVV